MRGLFTQTIALRLRSAEETRMVLGDGTATLAPAHRISPAAPGCGWLVDDDGTADRVRADHWPDPLVRAVATRYPAPVLEDTPGPASRPSPQSPDASSLPPSDAAVGPQDEPSPDTVTSFAAATGARVRRPRSPRTARRSRGSAVHGSGEAGWV